MAIFYGYWIRMKMNVRLRQALELKCVWKLVPVNSIRFCMRKLSGLWKTSVLPTVGKLCIFKIFRKCKLFCRKINENAVIQSNCLGLLPFKRYGCSHLGPRGIKPPPPPRLKFEWKKFGLEFVLYGLRNFGITSLSTIGITVSPAHINSWILTHHYH